ncbi:ArsA family ATPase [Thermocrinis minervae]|uniref:arsenite-transporting ATPase n=1 Tax=Thermocrinis minervae TaxID=381751 RepID=A0A1M6SQN5_9AQUI|nr:TRC40/GET3/ArsA family transport-energizing ATPase [Thermocrinis minervae]SHK47051.1 arsenite efflux ATP-binding protein ArsA [Thermocrinis minervae]
MLLKRIVLFGGKGGVGKSTLSCALSLKLSSFGKTLLLSLDPMHSLSGILKIEVPPEPREVYPNLFACELDAQKVAREYVDRVLENLRAVLSPKALEGFLRFASILYQSPTSLETASLDRLADYIMQGDYEYIILDFAPTGNMLRILNTIDLLKDWFGWIVEVAKEHRRISSYLGREEKLLDMLLEREKKVKTLKKTFEEKGILFAVARDEELSIEEAKRLLSYKGFSYSFMVMNACDKGEDFYVPPVEKPYGIENLLKLNVEPLLEVVL